MVKQIQSHLGFINEVDTLEITKSSARQEAVTAIPIQQPLKTKNRKRSKRDSDVKGAAVG